MSVEEVIEVMERADDPFLTLTEITEMTDVSKGTVHDRLEELDGGDRICKKQVGGRAVVWWLPEREPCRCYSEIKS